MGPAVFVGDVHRPEDEGAGADGDALGVVLAGGESTRFLDGDKALATVGGEPILLRVVGTLRRATGRPPLVAARTDEARSRYRSVLSPDVGFVADAADFSGPLAGVVGAAEAASAEWLFVCGCDMPLLAEPAVRWLLERARDGGADAVAVRSAGGAVEPLHACYRRSAVLAARDRLPPAGGVRSLFDVLGSTRTIPIGDAPDDVALAASLSNVNTRTELEAARGGTDEES